MLALEFNTCEGILDSLNSHRSLKIEGFDTNL